MSDENKSTEKTFELPMMSLFGLDLGREMGKLEARIDALDQKADNMGKAVRSVQTDVAEVKTDLRLLHERVKNLSMVTWGGIVVLLIAIIV